MTYVQPSRKEGMPNSLLEAILLNKICLVSNCIGGSEEVVQKYTDGLVFKSEDINDLAKKIEILLSRDHYLLIHKVISILIFRRKTF